MKLCIVDLETSGLDPDVHETLEIAAIVVDPRDLDHPLGRFEAVIMPSSWSFLDNLHPVVWDMHTSGEGGGLFGELQRIVTNPDHSVRHNASATSVAWRFGEFLRAHAEAPNGKPGELLVAGNSPHAVDTPFLRALFRKHGGTDFGRLVHYRQIDMTGVASMLDVFGFPVPPVMLRRSENAHRAMADVEHCLAQMRGLRDAYRPLLDVLAAPSPRSLGGIYDALDALRGALADDGEGDIGHAAINRARSNLQALDNRKAIGRLRAAAVKSEDASPAGAE